MTCQAGGRTAPYTISSPEGGRWSSLRPGRFPPRKKDPVLFGQAWMDAQNLPPPPRGSNPAPPARTESLHDCAIVAAAGTSYIRKVNFSPQLGQCQRSEVNRLVMGLSPRRTCFDPRSVHVGFVVDKVALAHVYLRLLRLQTLHIIPAALHTQLHHNNDLRGRTKQ